MRLAILAVLLSSVQALAAERLVTIGGGITESVCALGDCEKIVAVDSSSLFPESVSKLPQVGYSRALSAESIVAQKPSLVILGAEAGPPDVIAKLEALKIPIARIPESHSLDAGYQRIKAVAEALKRPADGEALVKKISARLDELQKSFKDKTKPRLLFLYARGAKLMQVAGSGTSVDTVIQLAGAENAVKGVEGFKPLTAEAVAAANPDFVLMTEKGVESLGGTDQVFALPGMKLTKAFQGKKLITEDDLRLLTIGPRTPDVVVALRSKFPGSGANE